MRVSLKGERNEQNEMMGDAYIEIIPKPSEMLNAVSAFRNPSVPKHMVSSQMAEIENITTITEGDRIIVKAHGMLRCSDKDVSINASTQINESLIAVRVEKVGHYATERDGKLALNMTFGPVIGVSLNNTKLRIRNVAGIQSNLPFKKVGEYYILESLPPKLIIKAEVSKSGRTSENLPATLPAILVASLIAIWILSRRTRK